MALRHAIHTLISVLMWCLFGYYWYLVTARGFSRSSLESLGILSVIITVGLVLTFIWVTHNIRLARRDRRQEFMQKPKEDLAEDYLNRPITAPSLQELRQARLIDISLDDEDRKIYSISSGGDG